MKIKIVLGQDGINMTHEAEITAYKTADPALFVTKQTWINKAGEVTQGKTWVITHKQTGMIVLKGYTKREYAIEGAAKLSELARWDGITAENVQDWYQVNKDHVIEIHRAIH